MERAGKLSILFEDDWIVAVDKPSGLLSVGYAGYRGKTAQDILADRYRSRGKIRIFAVHRLDRDTSGVMIFAKSAEARDRFMDGWQEIVTERTYRCVCERAPRAAALPDRGTIDEPIAYNAKNVGFVPRRDDEAARKGAERAVTRFRVLERGDRLDLVECELETGRKNQIRVHLSHLGHPILGDPVYGQDRRGGAAGKGASEGTAERLALHARIIAFTHPFTGDLKRFESAEPKDFAKAVRQSGSGPREGQDTRADRGKTGSGPRREASREGGPKGQQEPGRSGRTGRFANGSKYIPGT